MKPTRRIFIFIFTALIFSFAASAAFAQRNGNAALMRVAEAESGDRFGFASATRKGANVYAVRKPSAAVLDAIDKGLDELFAVARRRGYGSRLRHSDYTIFIARADRRKDRDGNYSPGIAISAGQYAGSDYDQGGYIFAAGMVIGFNPCAFIIAEHDREFGRISEVVRYEGEHLVLYHNDRRLYHQTADHSRGGGHPILK